MPASLDRWVAQAVTPLWVILIPRLAQACPACAGRDGGTTLETFAVLASMVAVPFLVSGVVIKIVRGIESDSTR